MSAKKHTFSPMEKRAFMDILRKFSNIIENKNTDGATLKKKNDAWDSVTREFNASPHVDTQITCKQLRRLWMNLKQRQREALTKERQHRVATGGGPSTSNVCIDPDVSQVAPALIIGIEDAIDSDTFTENITLDSDLLASSTESPTPLVLPTHSQPESIIFINTPPSPSPTSPTSVQNPPPPSTMTPLPHRNTAPPATNIMRNKAQIIEKEYSDRLKRADELHKLEIKLLKAKVREANAKADLAELILQREQSKVD